jgi:hypothetical protein
MNLLPSSSSSVVYPEDGDSRYSEMLVAVYLTAESHIPACRYFEFMLFKGMA